MVLTRIPITKSMTSLPWVYALLCPEKLNVEAVYAAPFTNDRVHRARRQDGEEL